MAAELLDDEVSAAGLAFAPYRDGGAFLVRSS